MSASPARKRAALHDLTAPYVLDALSRLERHAYERWLRHNPNEAHTVQRMRYAATALAAATSDATPSPHMRTRVLARINDLRSRQRPTTDVHSLNPTTSPGDPLACRLGRSSTRTRPYS